MKNLVKFCAIFMIFTSTTIFSANSLLDQNYTTQIAMLKNSQVPADATLSKKNINFIAPDYAQDMYLYCFYPYQVKDNNFTRYNKSQRFEISKNNHFKITLLQPMASGPLTIGPDHRLHLFLVPREKVQQYINELKSINPSVEEDGLHNPDAIWRGFSENEYTKMNAAKKLFENEFMFVANIDFSKISDGDTIHLPEYKPTIPTPKTLPLHPTAPKSINSQAIPSTTRMIKQSNERILTLRIPEQEIQVGVTLD